MGGDFAKLYDEEISAVYGFLAYRLRSRSDVEELTQRTFERALRSWSDFDPRRGQPRAWLLTIARNLLVDHYRTDRSRLQQPLDGVEEEQLGTELAAPDLGIEPRLTAALASLSPRDREIVALRFGGDLTGPEIAASTGLGLANVQQILSRSLRQMRAVLENGSNPAGR